jgi:hypothetical protein
MKEGSVLYVSWILGVLPWTFGSAVSLNRGRYVTVKLNFGFSLVIAALRLRLYDLSAKFSHFTFYIAVPGLLTNEPESSRELLFSDRLSLSWRLELRSRIFSR